MGKVVLDITMSLDGFIAEPIEDIGVTHLKFRVVK